MKYSYAIPSFMLTFTSLTNAHMMFNHEAVWGFKSQRGSLENPLNSKSGDKWLHHGATKDTNAVITLDPGSKPKFPITCGEAAGKANQAGNLCKTVPDIHKGGGCAISIAYPDGGKPRSGKDDFVIISVVHNCPTLGNFEHTFPMPGNLPKCDECVCAWHWVPDPSSSAAESYMNTFNCKVSGGNGGKITNGKKPIYYGVSGGSNENPRPLYKTKFPNGAQSLTIGGGTGASPDTTNPQNPPQIPEVQSGNNSTITNPPPAPENPNPNPNPVENLPIPTPTPSPPVNGTTNPHNGPGAENGGWGKHKKPHRKGRGGKNREHKKKKQNN